MRASEVDNRWEGGGGSRTTQSCLLKGTGRYPHLSNATEKDLSGPPRAGRKGFRIELCIGFGSVAATHTHAAERSNTKSVTLLAPSVIAIQPSIFPVPGPILINSFARAEIRYCNSYDVCRRVFNAHAHTHAHPYHPFLGRGSDVRPLCSLSSVKGDFLKVPNDGSHLGVGPCVHCRHI